MDLRDNSRTINIGFCTAGVIMCIASGFISAPEGLLSNGRGNILNSLAMPIPVLLFVFPAFMMLAACVFVAMGRFDIPPLAAAVCGTVLFAVLDIRLALAHQMFSGVLINMIGVIFVLTGVTLQVLATETGPAKVTRKAAKQRNSLEIPYERHHRPSYDDIYADSAFEFDTLNRSEEVMFADTMNSVVTVTDMADTEAIDIDAEDEAIMEKLLMVMSRSENKGSDEGVKAAPDDDDLLLNSLRELSEKDDIAGDVSEDTVVTDEDDLAEALMSMIEDDEQTLPAEDSAKANMAAALETPDPVMADFYGGIEEIFLND